MPEREYGFEEDVATESKERLKKPPLFRVLLHNDDFTTMEFVVEVLVQVFGKSEADAFRVMWASDTLPEYTAAFQRVVEYALLQAEGSGQKEVDGGNVLAALYQSPNSHAVYLLKKQGITRLDILNYLAHGISKVEGAGRVLPEGEDEEDSRRARDPLAAFTANLVERAAAGKIDPLIGREAEVARTIQVLCRRRKNNPIYVGDPGVGKTAIAEGLALKIQRGEV